MRILTKLGITLCMAGAFCYAENLNGKLIDASCYDNSHPGNTTATSSDHSSKGKLDKECAPSASTNSFALETSGKKVYRFDNSGNAKAAEAMHAGTLKSDSDGDVHVSISGSRQGDTVKVDSIQGKSENH